MEHKLDGPNQHLINEAGDGMNLMARVIGATTEEKGFRDDWKLADQLDALAEEYPEIDTDEAERILTAAANALRINIIGMKLMLTVSELSEALEELRLDGLEGVTGPEGGPFDEELADAHIRLLDLANMLGLDTGPQTVRKIRKNMDRPRMHGKKV